VRSKEGKKKIQAVKLVVITMTGKITPGVVTQRPGKALKGKGKGSRDGSLPAASAGDRLISARVNV
jgi:hypothetical protein